MLRGQLLHARLRPRDPLCAFRVGLAAAWLSLMLVSGCGGGSSGSSSPAPAAPPVAPSTASLSASLTSVSFGNVLVGSTASQPFSLTNTGNVSVTVSSLTVTSGSGFNVSGISLPMTLAQGQSASVTIQFAPTAAGSATGALSVVSNATGSPASVVLSGTAVAAVAQLTVNPAGVSFGSVNVGANLSQNVQITNTGNQSLNIASLTTTGPAFGVTGVTLPLTLSPGQSVNLNIQFAPTTAGTVTGGLSFVSNAANSPTSVALSGSGATATTQQITVNPSSLDYGSVLAGSSVPQNVSITNGTNQPITIFSSAISGPGFRTTGLTLPLTLSPGQSVNFTVVFSPPAPGSVSGNLSILSDAPNSPVTVSLIGNAVSGQLIQWDPSTDVVGYRVYRSATSGSGYVLLNTSLITGLSYIDSTVQSGKTYFYVATSVDSSGIESAYSNELRVTIP